MNRKVKFIALAAGLAAMFAFAGCGSKKPEVAASASIGGDAGAEGTEAADSKDDPAAQPSDELEPEANTGDVDFPEPPKRSSSGRKPIKFKMSVKKAYVLPLSEDGRCWDECSKDAKNTLVDALSQLSGDQFGSAAKALKTAMGAKDSAQILPDIYLHIDCGFGQDFTTFKASAEDRLDAKWRGAKETMKIDPEDECAISVWDADKDENDELLGYTVVKPIKKADAGELILRSEDEDMGQVFMVEIFFDQLDGPSVWGQPASAPAAAPVATPKPEPKPQPDTKPSPSVPSYTPKPKPGAAAYQVVVVKANLKNKKDDGQSWDTKIPFVGKDGTLPDPFVQGYVNGYQSEHPFMETTSVKDKLYNVWNETGEVKLKGTDKIHFMVWDKDKVDHDLMGECIADNMDSVRSGAEIVLRSCGQVDFIVVKFIKK